VQATSDGDKRGWLGSAWVRIVERVSWTRPTSTEVGVVLKAGLAAGLSWSIARLVTDVPTPALAPLTALVTVQVSVRSSMVRAILRSAAVVLGVLMALTIGDAIGLNGLTVGLLVAASLGLAELVLRLPAWAATQVPISVLVVLATAATTKGSDAWLRAVDTLIGAAVGVVVSLAFPASRVVDARQTLGRLADGLSGVLEAMGRGLERSWSTQQTTQWRRDSRTARHRLLPQAAEAVGDGREAARWNHRDRRHSAELARYEDMMPRAERVTIGVSAIARTLDEFAGLSDEPHPPLPKMSALLVALAIAGRCSMRSALGEIDHAEMERAMSDVRARRAECTGGAVRRARLAIEGDHGHDPAADEWLGYATVLVNVDRIVSDLTRGRSD
jgi:uncharacterized membrane protein YgaE (UPF0421/DUF939 family)